MLSMHNNEEYVWQALRGGAAGYLLKDGSPSELGLAIRRRDVGITLRLTPQISEGATVRLLLFQEVSDLIPTSQVEVLQLISEGHTNHQIAATLGISPKTVETHRAQLMLALGIHDVTGLVRYAVRAGIVSTND
jgi:DNA-binding NarL/FixJ family response regulator